MVILYAMLLHTYQVLVTQTSSGKVLIPIPNDELGGLQYLSGYVVHKFLKKTRKQKNNVIVLKILENMVSPDDSDQELIDVQNRGGLMYATATTQKILLIAEETFRYQTSTLTDVKKIDTRQMVKDLIKNVDVISAYNNAVDPFVDDDDIKYPLLETMLPLYLRLRSFPLAKNITTRYRMLNTRGKKKALRSDLKALGH